MLKLQAMKGLTREKVDGLRGELFHMILFSMAWMLIGEQVFNFRDYALGAGVVLAVVVWLALYSNRLYEVEDRLPPDGGTVDRKGGPEAGKGGPGDGKSGPGGRIGEPAGRNGAPGGRKRMRRDQLFAGILFFEGVAILVTWILLLNWGHSNWMISMCALVAGLHFFPLAWSIHQQSYYFLGIWTSLVAITGYWLIRSGNLIDHDANVLVAYGCAAASVVDGVVVVIRTRNLIRS